jgi:hypothetical protein
VADGENWKTLGERFKQIYGIPMNPEEIELSLFLSCMMELVEADYNIQELSRNKGELRNGAPLVIPPNFVERLKPKVTGYRNFTA